MRQQHRLALSLVKNRQTDPIACAPRRERSLTGGISLRARVLSGYIERCQHQTDYELLRGHAGGIQSAAYRIVDEAVSRERGAPEAPCLRMTG